MLAYDLEIEQAMKNLYTSGNGLREAEAKKRLQKYGYNEIEEKKISPAKIFLRQFKNFLILILIFAAAISFAIAEITNTIIISFIILFVAALGFVQEYRAERAMQALKKMLQPECIVVRDGKQKTIPAREVVPGDILVLESGDSISADARIAESFSLEANEALLTGESAPVEKNATEKNMLFAGTTVTKGHAKAVVISTGMNTKFGKIAREIETIEEQVPLIAQLSQLTKQLGTIAILVCISVLFLGLAKGEQFFNILIVALAVAVAGMPEALPAVVTVSLALGTQKMARKKAIVRLLPAVETLGCTNIICSDKTGTMTKGEMTVTRVYTDKIISVSGVGYEPEGKFFIGKKEIIPKNDAHLSLLLKSVFFCNNSNLERTLAGWKIDGDPTEGALLVAALKAGLRNGKRIAEFPFDDMRKIMSVVSQEGKEYFVYTKGAIEKILEKSTHFYKNGKIKPLTERQKKKILRTNEKMCAQGLRVIAGAYKKINRGKISQQNAESGLAFLGLLGMIDPPRAEVKESIRLCKQAGIKVIMITGDNPVTAEAIGRNLGLKGKILTEQELETLTDDEISKAIDDVGIISRACPEHKLRIVEVLKRKGYTVAVTGDGVNDAPALKSADIGIAMGSGTDVAKEAADVVLTDDNFSTIISAVEEGRNIYDNIKKFASFLMTCNFAEVSIIFLGMLLGLPLPLLALQILFVNLVTDELPALGLSAEHGRHVMQKPPRRRDEKILSAHLFMRIIPISMIILTGTLFVFAHYLPDLEKARTMAFATLIFFELFNAFNSRSIEHSLLRVGVFSNKKLVVAVFGSLMAMLSAIYLPFLQDIFKTVHLSATDFLFAAAVASTVLIASELRKRFIG